MEPYTRTDDVAGIIARKEAHERIAAIRSADILVGIPSYNNARTIGHVVRAVQAGLAKYFPYRKAVIMNSDGGSTDGTVEIVKSTIIDDYGSVLLRHRGEPAITLSVPYHGIPGKGSAFRAIFEMATALNVQACAVLDADLRSITPEWMELLIKPVLEHGFDYVAPLYHRHKFDGTITNSIIYPLTRALYGKRIRQPIGGDFGFSGRLARFYLSEDVWETDVARYGIDIWMTTGAIANEFKVGQAFLGAKIHDPKDPGSDLSSMLYQVVGSAFGLMSTYQGFWETVQGSEPVPTFGFKYAVGLEQVKVDVDRMLHALPGRREEPEGDMDHCYRQRGFRGTPEDSSFPGQATSGSPTGYGRASSMNMRLLIIRKRSRRSICSNLLPRSISGRQLRSFSRPGTWIRNRQKHGSRQLCSEFEENKQYLVNNWT